MSAHHHRAAGLLLGCLFFSDLLANATLAKDELQFIIQSVKPTNGAYLILPDDTRQDCDPGKTAGGSAGYLCTLPEIGTMQSVDTYKLSVESPDIDIRLPVRIRVYPTMKSPTLITIDLRNDVFSKDFKSDPTYFAKWRHDDETNDNFTYYLIARNLFPKLNEEINTATALVIRRWMEHAARLTQNYNYVAIDTEVLNQYERIYKDPSSVQKTVLDSIFKGFNPSLLNWVRYGDWTIFKNSLKTDITDAKNRHPDFCRLYKAFWQLWDKADLQDNGVISEIKGIKTQIENPDTTVPFKGCTVN